MSTIEVKVPDIGDFKDVPVIEVLVKPGDTVAIDDSLVTLESDKATMEVPSPAAGTVTRISVKAGDKVAEGSIVLTLETDDRAPSPKPSPAGGSASANAGESAKETQPRPARADGTASATSEGDGVRRVASRPGTATAPPAPELITPAPRGEKGLADMPGEGANSTPPAGPTIEVRVPDIGGFKDVPVIEVFVKPGDIVQPDDPLVTIESDKATMDVPAPVGGTVEGVRIAVGERVSEGTPLLTLKTSQTGAEPASRSTPPTFPANADRAVPPIQATSTPPASTQPAAEGGGARERTEAAIERTEAQPSRQPSPEHAKASAEPVDEGSMRTAHASPSVRKFARELGVNLGRVTGSGPKGRIQHEDVQQFVKRALASPAAIAAATGIGGGALNLLPWPNVDFAKFGPVESKPLSRIRKISGANLARNWAMIPHVTQFDAADITELDALRIALNKENDKAGVKVTMLAFLVKASAALLQRFPDFNASLDPSGENVVYKRYFNIGFAADTPNGLVVPVVKGADGKGVLQIAQEMTDLSAKAREGKLGPADMQGGCFSISSLGGIGGTAFTPIINAPEVAILGVSRSAMKPVWDGKAFVPRLMLPLSLSYDHRVIDGAQAARFITYFAGVLADFRRVLL
ncbi:MAG: dihydrolipoyllysine-residue acetyltransferase [Pseudomonadota bacterium]|nr:dihydrolipoyllysine-residue acetyltransferase [Pseudomonadota bacterium]